LEAGTGRSTGFASLRTRISSEDRRLANPPETGEPGPNKVPGYTRESGRDRLSVREQQRIL